jgi:hypothetical protein
MPKSCFKKPYNRNSPSLKNCHFTPHLTIYQFYRKSIKLGFCTVKLIKSKYFFYTWGVASTSAMVGFGGFDWVWSGEM